MKNKRKRVVCLLLALLTVVQLLTVFCVTATAAGETATTSGVLEDLQRDPDFNVADYPENAKDHSVQVIQVAEGVNGELFLYVYRPEGTTNAAHRAKYINMSLQNPTAVGVEKVNSRYYVTWLNSNGVFEKYQVNNFAVSSETYRYYNIAAVYRPYDEAVDTPEDDSVDDTTNCKGFPVGVCFEAYYYNDTLAYSAAAVDVVDIDIKAVGSVRYTDGFYFYGGDYCDSHFVAFSIENYDVKKIFDADVSYHSQRFYFKWSIADALDPEETYTDLGIKERKLSENDTASNDGSGFLGYKYTWKRIVTVKEFEEQLEEFKNSDLEFVKGELGSGEFVFQFLETDYSTYSDDYRSESTRTIVDEVTVLRLHFWTEEGVFNLGVVGDIVSDDGQSDFNVDALDNIENKVEDYLEWFEKIMAVVLVILAIVFFSPIVTPIVTFVFQIFGGAIKFLLKLVWKILLLPFKILKKLLFPKKE